MSHDLFLYPDPPRSLAEFLEFLPRVGLKREGTAQALYRNEDTDCYFLIDYMEGEGRPYLHVNLNYFRPSTFGLEAAPVIEKLASAWNCTVQDPPISGTWRPLRQRDVFAGLERRQRLRGSCHMNMPEGGLAEGYYTAPRQRDPRCLELEFEADGLAFTALDLTNGAFVPKLNWLKLPDAQDPVLMAVWPDDLHSVLPPHAAYVVLGGNRLAKAPACLPAVPARAGGRGALPRQLFHASRCGFHHSWQPEARPPGDARRPGGARPAFEAALTGRGLCRGPASPGDRCGVDCGRPNRAVGEASRRGARTNLKCASLSRSIRPIA